MKATKIWLISILLIVAFAFVYRFSNVIILFILAAVFAFLISPMTDSMAKRLKCKRVIAAAIVFILVFAAFAILISFLIPVVSSQLAGISYEAPKYFDSINKFVNDFLTQLTVWKAPDKLKDAIRDFILQSDQYVSDFISGLMTGILHASLKILDIIIVLVLTFYFVLDSKRFLYNIEYKLPDKFKLKFHDIVAECDTIIWKYLKSKAIISAIVSVITYIALLIMGVKFTLVWAIFTFVLNFIPYFGSIIAGVVIAVFVLATMGVMPALIVIIILITIQQIEGGIITPRIQAKSIGIHPVVVILAVLAGNEIMGPLGMFIAVPVAGFIKIILKEVYLFLIDKND